MNDDLKRVIEYGFKAIEALEEGDDPLIPLSLYELGFWNVLAEIRKKDQELDNYLNEKEEDL